MPFSLHCMVALNLHNKCLPKRFDDEESETIKVHKGGLKHGQYKGYPETPTTLNRIGGDKKR